MTIIIITMVIIIVIVIVIVIITTTIKSCGLEISSLASARVLLMPHGRIEVFSCIWQPI